MFLYLCQKDNETGKYYEYITEMVDGGFQEEPRFEIGTLLFTTINLLPSLLKRLLDNDLKEKLNDYFQIESFYKFILECGRKNSDVANLENYYNFLNLCLKDKSHCTMEDLTIFCSMIGLSLKGGNLLSPELNITHSVLSREQIQNELNWRKQPDNSIVYELTGVSIKPKYKGVIYFYPVSSVEDLLSASLQEIFKAGLVIKECGNCHRMFIPYEKRTDIKYCEKIWPENKGKTCGQIAKAKNQLLHDRSSYYQKRHKSIRTMISHKLQEAVSTDEEKFLKNQLKVFRNETKITRALVKLGKYSEEDFVDDMNEYWEKVKKEVKERRAKKKP